MRVGASGGSECYQTAIRNLNIYNFQVGLFYGGGYSYVVPPENVFVSCYPFPGAAVPGFPGTYGDIQITAYGYGGMPSKTGGYSGGPHFGSDVIGIRGATGPNCTVLFDLNYSGVSVGFQGPVGSDIWSHTFQALGCSIGYIYDGAALSGGPNSTADNHFYEMILDQCVTGVVVMNTLQSGGGMFVIDNFWVSDLAESTNGTGLGYHIYLNNAGGVRVTNGELYSTFTDTVNAAIIVENSSDCSIGDCIIEGNWLNAIYIPNSNFVTIHDNNILQIAENSTGNASGVFVSGGSNGVTFTGNTIRSDATLVTGFNIYSGTNVVLSGNVVDVASVTNPFLIGGSSTGVIAKGNVGFPDTVTRGRQPPSVVGDEL